MESYRNTFLKVDLNNLQANYNFYKEKTDKAIFAVVKANAYGLGVKAISKTLIENNTDYLAVATLDEAMEIRSFTTDAPILVMGYVPVIYAHIAAKNNISLTVISEDWAKQLSANETSGLTLHLKVNSSMNRLGHDDLHSVLNSFNLLKDKHCFEGIFTHYCCKDEKIVEKDFKHFKNIVDKINYKFKWIHASSSGSSLALNENFTNAVRLGIGLYGGLKANGLKNVVSLKTEVSLIRTLNIGDTVSYEGIYVADKNVKIAILPIGYADGLWRSDTGNKVFIKGQLYPIVGLVCMDQVMVEVDDMVNLYDEVEIFGDHIDIDDVANRNGTINYDVLTSISSRVSRKYIK